MFLYSKAFQTIAQFVIGFTLMRHTSMDEKCHIPHFPLQEERKRTKTVDKYDMKVLGTK